MALHFVVEVRVDGELTYSQVFYTAQAAQYDAGHQLFHDEQRRVTQYACRCEHPEAHSNGRRQRFT